MYAKNVARGKVRDAEFLVRLSEGEAATAVFGMEPGDFACFTTYERERSFIAGMKSRHAFEHSAQASTTMSGLLSVGRHRLELTWLDIEAVAAQCKGEAPRHALERFL